MCGLCEGPNSSLASYISIISYHIRAIVFKSTGGYEQLLSRDKMCNEQNTEGKFAQATGVHSVITQGRWANRSLYSFVRTRHLQRTYNARETGVMQQLEKHNLKLRSLHFPRCASLVRTGQQHGTDFLRNAQSYSVEGSIIIISESI